MGRVIIGVDPHKLSATIEVLDQWENVLGRGRFGTDRDGYRQMLTVGRRWPVRAWAVEGCNGIGRHVAQRLVADGETVLDVPAKLSARARVFSTGHGRKTDATDAHAIAVVAVRTPSLTPVSVDDELVAFAAAGRPPRRTCRRPHPHGVPAAPAATRAHPRWRTPIPVRHPSQSTPGHGPTAGWPGRTRRRLAAELLAVIVVLDRKLKDSDRRLTEAVAATGSRLPDLYGIGPVGAARILGDVSNIARFQTKAHFASWTGTAPIDASSGQQQRHRLSRAGNRRLNRVLHIMAIVQIRHDTEGRDYYRRKLAAGKIPMEAMRCPKRRLSDAVYRQLLTDSQPNHPAFDAGPGGHSGATLPSSAADLTPHIGTSDQPQPEPAPPTLPGPQPTRHPSGVSLTARPNRRPKPRP